MYRDGDLDRALWIKLDSRPSCGTPSGGRGETVDAGLDDTVTVGLGSGDDLLRGDDIAAPRTRPGASGNPCKSSSSSARGRGALVGVLVGLRGDDLLGVVDDDDSPDEAGVSPVGVGGIIGIIVKGGQKLGIKTT